MMTWRDWEFALADARMVKRRAKAAGYAPELFSGHSLRSGFATTAA